jgi:hypothetical protein
MSRRGTNKKTMTMTPIIELKRQSSRLKHYITLFLNILLVDCYVGKLLWRNHMVCILRRPMSNLIVFIFHHHPNHATFWPFPQKVAWGFELLKTQIMFEGSKTGRPASRTQFFQGSSHQRLEKFLFYSIFYVLDTGTGLRKGAFLQTSTNI